MPKFIQLLQQARQNVTALPGALLTSFNVKSAEELPESLRTPFTSFASRATEIAGTIPDQVEEDAAAPALAKALQGILDGQNSASTVIVALHGELAEARQSLDGFQKRITDGELLTQEQATELAQTTATQRVTEAEQRFGNRITRLQSITAAGLPEPTDQAILDAGQEAFDASVTAAKERAGKLGAVGITHQSAPGVFRQAAWDAGECNRTLELSAVMSKATARPAPAAHPFGTPPPAGSTRVALG